MKIKRSEVKRAVQRHVWEDGGEGIGKVVETLGIELSDLIRVCNKWGIPLPYVTINQQTFCDVVWDQYVIPEQEKRIKSSDDPLPPFHMFQIIWTRKDRKPRVRFDREVKFYLHATAPQKAWRPNDLADLDEIEILRINRISLVEEEQGCAHITFFKIRGTWQGVINRRPDLSLEKWPLLFGVRDAVGDPSSGEIQILVTDSQVLGDDRVDFEGTKRLTLRKCEVCGRTIFLTGRSDKQTCSDRCRSKKRADGEKGKNPHHERDRKKKYREKKKQP